MENDKSYTVSAPAAQLGSISPNSEKKEFSMFRDFMYGSLSGIAGLVVGFPMDTIKVILKK